MLSNLTSQITHIKIYFLWAEKNEDQICFPKYDPDRKMVASYRPLDLENLWIDKDRDKIWR